MKNLKASKILKTRFSILLTALLSLLATKSSAINKSTHWNESVSTRIDSLLTDDIFDLSQVGIYIYDLTENQAIYKHNECQTMRPASTQKLITAISALNTLGADHRMHTTISYKGSIDGRTLNGDIYCKGSFDPLLSTTNIRQLAREVKDFGIDTIRGKFLLDISMKDTLKLGKGWCWDDDNPILSPLTVDGRAYFYSDITRALRNAGVTMITKSGIGQSPRNVTLICSVYHTIGNILPKMLKESDNFFAEAMFYNLAASFGRKWSGRKEAAAKISQLSNSIGHSSSEYRIADGCGLSLYNYTTPSIEVDFLRYAYSKDNIYNYLYEALPIAGIDGTLEKRMTEYKHTRGNVRAKTGSVSCVSTLAGYCKAFNGHEIAFCIMNQGLLKLKKARIFQDKVCAILCEPLNTKIQ